MASAYISQQMKLQSWKPDCIATASWQFCSFSTFQAFGELTCPHIHIYVLNDILSVSSLFLTVFEAIFDPGQIFFDDSGAWASFRFEIIIQVIRQKNCTYSVLAAAFLCFYIIIQFPCTLLTLPFIMDCAAVFVIIEYVWLLFSHCYTFWTTLPLKMLPVAGRSHGFIKESGFTLVLTLYLAAFTSSSWWALYHTRGIFHGKQTGYSVWHVPHQYAHSFRALNWQIRNGESLATLNRDGISTSCHCSPLPQVHHGSLPATKTFFKGCEIMNSIIILRHDV